MKKLLLVIISAFLFTSCSQISGGFEEDTKPMPREPEASETAATTPDEPLTVEALVDSMTLEEQVGQMFFARCPDAEEAWREAVEECKVGGFILFARDFNGLTPDEVKDNIRAYQMASTYPLLIGIDEEGGTVVRASKYQQHRYEKFPSPQEVYAAGGLEAVRQDVLDKSEFLRSYGVNINLAPVADVTENPEDYIYDRTLGKNAAETAEYISAAVKAYNEKNFGCTLKHFPGYGSNVDTHTGIALDSRSYEEFKEGDFLPFKAGIEAGANAVMVNHNIIQCLDEKYPASLSPAVHKALREELGFDGVVMTDDLDMDAIAKYTYGENARVLAVIAGNDMLIDSSYKEGIEAVIAAVNDGKISKEQIRESALRVLKLKEQLGLL